MKTQSKSVMEMTDAQVMKAFGDPSRSLRLMKLGHEVEYLAGQQSEHNILALVIYRGFQNKKPIKHVLLFVMDCYKDNPSALIAMFGEELINQIQTALYEE